MSRVTGRRKEMPGGYRKGPEGKGPATGRGLGRSSGSDRPGRESEEAPRRGLRDGSGKGRGKGRGQGNKKGTGRLKGFFRGDGSGRGGDDS